MNIRFNIEKSQRKALAQKIGELTGSEVKYLGVPSCAYEIGFFTLSKDAVLSFADRMDTEVIERVLDGLADAGYGSETVTPPEGTDETEADEPEETDAEPEPTEPHSGFPIDASISFSIHGAKSHEPYLHDSFPRSAAQQGNRRKLLRRQEPC